MRGIKSIIAVSCGYAAAIIGAGFASGQEVISFFVRFGRLGIIGIIIACAVFTIFSYAVLVVCVQNNLHSYDEFLSAIFPKAYMRRTAKYAALSCAAASVCVMTACAGEAAHFLLGLPSLAGAASFAAVCAIILFFDVRRVMGINSALGAVIAAGIIFCCFYILRFREHQTLSIGITAAISGVSYAGYNLVSAGAALAGMSANLKTKGDAALASAAAGMILFIMLSLIWGVLGIYYGKINLGEIPMLTMAFRQNYIFGIFYGIMLALAILTTGIASGFAVTDMAGAYLGRRKTAAALMLTGLCMSGAGFANLIDTLYKFCGYAGAVVVFAIITGGLLKIRDFKRK